MICDHCALLFHTGPGAGEDGCDCDYAGCGCRIRREGFVVVGAPGGPEFQHPWENA